MYVEFLYDLRGFFFFSAHFNSLRLKKAGFLFHQRHICSPLKLNKFTPHQFAKHTPPLPPTANPTTASHHMCRSVPYFPARRRGVSLRLRLPLPCLRVCISNKSAALPLYHSEVTSWGWRRSPSPSLPDWESSLLL